MKPHTLARFDTAEPGFSFGRFRLEPDGTLFRGETPVHLPPKELAALRLLLTHAGQVVPPTQLKEFLWGDVHVTPDSVPRCLSSLRTLLEPDPCIQTVYKRGYRLAGPVRRHGSHATCVWRMAIMPFAVGRNVAEHLGQAIAEEVTTRLTVSYLPAVSVLARDSVFSLARRGLTAAEVGEALKADLVLTGVLHAMPSHFRLRTEMIRIEDGTQIWVEDMLVSRSRVARLESELVQRLAFRLGGDFSIAADTSTAADPQDESSRRAAYEMFLRGHHEWQTLERHRMQDGMQHLLHAAELDPSLIVAQVDLANACVTQEIYGFMSPAVAADQIRRIGNAIPDVAGNAPAILPALGWFSFHVDRDLHRALELFSLSAHLPHDPSTTRLRVMFALSRHRFDEAGEWLRSALLVDPYAPWLRARLAWAYHLAGEADKSVEQIEQTLSLFPDHESANLYGSVILAFNGQAARGARLAQELVRRTPYFDIATAVHAYALARQGQQDDAREVLERLQWLSRERFVLSSFTAAAYVALGDVEGAIAELRSACDARCPWFFQTLADPRLKALRGIPEFDHMLADLEQLESTVREDFAYES